MSPTEILSLAAVSALAGVINAVAGGGTILTFPALLAFGTPPIVANATSTMALLVGTAGSVFGFRRHLAAVRPWLVRFLPVSLVGGWLGSYLLTRTEDRVFSRLVPFLILFATLLFLSQGLVRRLLPAPSTDGARPPRRGAILGALVFQFVVSIYGGYFGAGIGILMLATLGFLGLRNIHEMNTLKTVLGSLINLVASLWLMGAGLVHWPKAAVMALGAVSGYYLGAHYSQRIPQAYVRHVITAVGFVLSAATFYHEFLR